ncbi:preprotein translocase subunit SecG [Patescibacteria group bacterium]|nr:preprotein translocase subunit SecG [Patescibacteria group bacterium]
MIVYLPFVQIIISVLIIALILLQQRGTALGSAFGGGGDGGFYATRRGIQQKLYWATIVLAITFIALVIFNLLII